MKIFVENHLEHTIAYCIRPQGILVGEGSTREEALADLQCALKFYQLPADVTIFEYDVVMEEAPIERAAAAV